MENFALVVEANGAVVSELCDCNGHRRGTGTGRCYTAPSDNQLALDINGLDLHANYREVLEVHSEEWGNWQQQKNTDSEDDNDSN